MTSNRSKDPPISDEDDCSGEDERIEDRRRRFCIERKQQLLPEEGSSKVKRPRTTANRGRGTLHPYHGRHPTRRRRPFLEPRHRSSRQIIPVEINDSLSDFNKVNCINNRAKESINTALLNESNPTDPVIFINPKFIKRFVEKSIQLTITATQPNLSKVESNSLNEAATSAQTCMLDEIDFRKSTRESLQAAATMAIIRLVTECIENDNKRDERLNKILVNRLIDTLVTHGNRTSAEDRDEEATTLGVDETRTIN